MTSKIKQLESKSGHFNELEMSVYHMRLTDSHIAEQAAEQLYAKDNALRDVKMWLDESNRACLVPFLYREVCEALGEA